MDRPRLDYILVGWPRDMGFGTVTACGLAGTKRVTDKQAGDDDGVVVDLTRG